MGRQFLYGFLGFIIFGIVGIMFGVLVWPGSAEETSTVQVGLTALFGCIATVLLARWMNSAGGSKLDQFSRKPKIDYGIWGALLGACAAFYTARTIDPSDVYPMQDLSLIAAGIIVCAYCGVKLARRYDLPSFMKVAPIGNNPDLSRSSNRAALIWLVIIVLGALAWAASQDPALKSLLS